MSSRRGFLGTAMSAAALPATGAGARPNILYIHSHDSGRYLQPYGFPVPTPSLDRLAREGVLFRQAYSGAPTCSPSRAALLTGQPAHTSGMIGLAHRGFSLKDYRQHLVHTLRGAGYQSVLAGIQHVAAKSETVGYHEILRPKSMSAVNVAPAAVEFLNRKPAGPFFLDVGFFETHRKYPQPTPADDPRYTQPPTPVPDTPQTRFDTASYHASARVLDNGVGRVLEALERNGLANNTLVISTTDHGLAFPGMKCNLEDFGWGVSLIVRGPGGFTGGRVNDSLVSHVDVFPTLCEVLDVPRPAWLTGRSLLPLIRDEKKEINDAVFAEVTYHAAYEPKRAIRTKRWKYIRRYGDRTTQVLPNCDDGPSKSLWLEHGWKNIQLPRESLFDLVFDPTERNNLAAGGAAREPLEELRTQLDTWMRATGDPLLNGPVPAPHGSKVNAADGVSPKETPVEIP